MLPFLNGLVPMTNAEFGFAVNLITVVRLELGLRRDDEVSGNRGPKSLAIELPVKRPIALLRLRPEGHPGKSPDRAEVLDVGRTQR